MARTTKPLTIVVAQELYETTEVRELAAQGHTIIPQGFKDIDLVLAPQAHRMDGPLLAYLPAAISAARRRKEGK